MKYGQVSPQNTLHPNIVPPRIIAPGHLSISNLFRDPGHFLLPVSEFEKQNVHVLVCKIAGGSLEKYFGEKTSGGTCSTTSQTVMTGVTCFVGVAISKLIR